MSMRNDKLFIPLLLMTILIISLIRVLPKLQLLYDQFAFWGVTADFIVEVNGIAENEGIPSIDPKYVTFSKAFYPIRFSTSPVWSTFVAFLKQATSLPTWMIGKFYIYVLGILGSFTSYFITRKLTKNVNVSLLSGLFVNLVPYYVVWTGIARFMVFAVPLIPLCFYFLIEGMERKEKKFIVLSGLFAAGVLASHNFTFWVVAMTLLSFTILSLLKCILKKKFYTWEFFSPIAVIFICLSIILPFSVKYPFFQNSLNNGWIENSPRTVKQYMNWLGIVPISLSTIGAASSVYLVLKKKCDSQLVVFLFIWLFSVWWGLEDMRIGEKIITRYVRPLIKIPQLYNLVWRSFVPLTSSRFFVHLAQPVAIFSSLGMMSIHGIIKRLVKKRFVREFLFVLLFIALVVPGAIHSYNIAKPFISIGPSNDGWEVIKFVCEELPDDASVLSDVALGESILMKCNKQFLAYYTYAKDPFFVYKVWGYIISNTTLDETLKAISKYKITHIVLNKHLNSVYILGKFVNIEHEKFRHECFRKVFDNLSLEVYEVRQACIPKGEKFDDENVKRWFARV